MGSASCHAAHHMHWCQEEQQVDGQSLLSLAILQPMGSNIIPEGERDTR